MRVFLHCATVHYVCATFCSLCVYATGITSCPTRTRHRLVAAGTLLYQAVPFRIPSPEATPAAGIPNRPAPGRLVESHPAPTHQARPRRRCLGSQGTRAVGRACYIRKGIRPRTFQARTRERLAGRMGRIERRAGGRAVGDLCRIQDLLPVLHASRHPGRFRYLWRPRQCLDQRNRLYLRRYHRW